MAILKDNVFNNSVLSSFLSKSGDTSDGTLAASNLQPLLGFNRVGESSKTLADTVTIARSGQLLFLTVNVATVNDDATFNTSTDTKALSTALKNAQIQLASSQADLATANATQAAAQSALIRLMVHKQRRKLTIMMPFKIKKQPASKRLVLIIKWPLTKLL